MKHTELATVYVVERRSRISAKKGAGGSMLLELSAVANTFLLFLRIRKTLLAYNQVI